MTSPRRPSLESSATLRALIHAKRQRGHLADALILARLGARIATGERVGNARDALSQQALARYLAVMPGDVDAQQALDRLAPRPRVRRWLLWLLFIVSGVTAAGTMHLQTLPTPQPPIAALPPVRKPAPRPAPPAPPKDEKPIVIRAVGDVVLGSDFPSNRLPGPDERQRIAALRHDLGEADLVLGNLEGVLHDQGATRKDTSRAGVFAFRMPQRYAAMLREMGFHALSLANNHSLDFGPAGLASTIRTLREEGIQPFGVPGAEMAIIEIRQTKVALLNYSYLPTFAHLDDDARIREEIHQARQAADLVLVSVHGGKEGEAAAGAPRGAEYFMGEYRGDLRRFAQLAIDAGASAVFGHGPHVVRPYEVYQDKPIFYSLGNFIGYRTLSTRGKLASSVIAEVRFGPKGQWLGAGVIPLRLDRSGIPSVDYSAASLDTLDGLLDERLDKRPVLRLARCAAADGCPPAEPATPAATSSRPAP